jgi:hypothetical protein
LQAVDLAAFPIIPHLNGLNSLSVAVLTIARRFQGDREEAIIGRDIRVRCG